MDKPLTKGYYLSENSPEGLDRDFIIDIIYERVRQDNIAVTRTDIAHMVSHDIGTESFIDISNYRRFLYVADVIRSICYKLNPYT